VLTYASNNKTDASKNIYKFYMVDWLLFWYVIVSFLYPRFFLMTGRVPEMSTWYLSHVCHLAIISDSIIVKFLTRVYCDNTRNKIYITTYVRTIIISFCVVYVGERCVRRNVLVVDDNNVHVPVCFIITLMVKK